MYETTKTLPDGTTYEIGNHPDLPPPAASTGVMGWVKENLFSSVFNTILTLVVAVGLFFVIPPIYGWFVGNATTHGETNATCDIADKVAYVPKKWERLNVAEPDFKNRSYKTQVSGMGDTVRTLGQVADKARSQGNEFPAEFESILGSLDLNAIGAAMDEAAAAQDLAGIDQQMTALAPLTDWAKGYAGGCWALVKKRASYLTFYRYDEDQRWRVWIVWLLLALAVIPVLVDKIPYRKEGMVYALTFPFIAFFMLAGYQFPAGLSWIVPQFGQLVGNPLGSWLSSIQSFGQIFTNLAGLNFSGAVLSLASSVYYLLSPILLLALFLFRLVLPFAAAWFVLRRLFDREDRGHSLSSFVGYIFGLAVTLILFYFCWFSASDSGGHIPLGDLAGRGLSHVKTADWGGLMLTMVIGITGIVASLPIGIVLALGRRSKLKIISIVCVGFIEFVRAVPLITILFMASTMLPLFGPEGWNPDKLLRALVGVALFSSAYMAEVVRGGLQALPKGQYEGAMSMGLSYWKMTYLITLPQALRIVIPGIVNTFIGLFKDTVLVIIIGMKDLLGAAQSTTTTPNWRGMDYEAYITVAIVFFIFCFAMSRYSIWLEEKLKKATTH